MQILIIEDEPLGLERLLKQLRELDAGIEVVGTAESIGKSIAWLSSHPAPDLILMDIELTDGQSFEIFKQVKVQSAVIFTTSYDEYALQAFKVNSIDYLLKPIKKEELRQALDKFKQLKVLYQEKSNLDIDKLLQSFRLKEIPNQKNRFLVKQGQRLIPIEVSEIAYFYLEDRVTFFRTWKNERFVVDYTLDELENMLKSEDFKRVGRQIILHIKAIGQIHNYFKGRLKLELKPPFEKEVTVSREGATDFKIWLGK